MWVKIFRQKKKKKNENLIRYHVIDSIKKKEGEDLEKDFGFVF